MPRTYEMVGCNMLVEQIQEVLGERDEAGPYLVKVSGVGPAVKSFRPGDLLVTWGLGVRLGNQRVITTDDVVAIVKDEK